MSPFRVVLLAIAIVVIPSVAHADALTRKALQAQLSVDAAKEKEADARVAASESAKDLRDSLAKTPATEEAA